MKRFLVLVFSLIVVNAAMAQIVLTGDLKPSDVPAYITTPLSGITTLEQLNQRLDAGGDLVVRDGVLTVPPGSGEVFWALDELTLQSCRIETNGANLKIICRKLNALWPAVNSFTVIPTAGTNGINGLNGRNGGKVTLYVLDHFQGKMGLGLLGEHGGSGVNGKAGKTGGNGSSSKEKHGFCKKCAKGGSVGGNGTDGGNGGNGGNAGDVLVYVTKNPAAFPTQNLLYGNIPGEAGAAGAAGAAGIGGKGGKNHGTCKISCAKPASRARSGKAGKAGVAGVAGTKGKLEVRLFTLTDLLQTQTVVKE